MSRDNSQLPSLIILVAVLSAAIAMIAFRSHDPGGIHELGNSSTNLRSLWFDLIQETATDGTQTLSISTDFEISGSWLAELKSIPGLEILNIDQGRVTDKDLDHLTALQQLRNLRLRLSPVGDEGLEKLLSCKKLEVLNLPQATCSAHGIAKLAGLANLTQLRVGSESLGNEVCDSLLKLRSLEGLHLIGVKITDDGLKKIAKLSKLQSLYLDDSLVTDAGWDWLFEQRPDIHVHINQKHHDRDPNPH